MFHGNPAAVCILEAWPPEDLMRDIALENNLSETAYAVKEEERYHLRWFTPGGEIDLCGHATLATAFVLMNFYEPGADRVRFTTLSGQLTVTRSGERYELEFPAYELIPTAVTEEMTGALGAEIREAYLGRDLLCVLDSEETVRALDPDFERLKALPGLLVHVTAAGEKTDCVSRSFAPKLNVSEDPVCGSGHCHIVPYWADRLQKPELVACQASRRGGTLYCRRAGDRVFLAGTAVLFSEGEIHSSSELTGDSNCGPVR